MKLPLYRFKLARVFESITDYQNAVFAGVICLPMLATMGCSSAITPAVASSASPSKAAATSPSIKITPGNPTVAAGANVQFAALVSNTSDTAVSWSASGGVISNNGMFTVPKAPVGSVFQIVATSRADYTTHAVANVAIAAAFSPINPGPISPNPISPNPINPNPTNPGPTNPGSTNPGSGSTPTTGPDNRYCNSGDIPNFGAADGPAAAPVACYQTAAASTPSQGAVIKVSSSANLQTAIDNASCGDTLVLQAGQTYPGFTLRAKGCDANHYIIIQSSAAGSGLPAEGVRATPCNAGVGSLPGRPALNCASTSNVMARVAGIAKADKIIGTDQGANFYRLVGLEIADTEANGASAGYYDLILLDTADHIVFDRCWIHGSPIGEDVKGVAFTNSSYIAVIDSYISDIHSKVSGWGADSAAIASLTGTGPIKIVDNFLEASGENVLWGGGASTTSVSDVEMRRNHLFKPFTWWKLSPSYFGTLFVVKNLYESKMGIRQFVEGNIFENNWAMAQKGTGILFTPKNQYGECSECAVHDIIFRYNILRHSVDGIGMAPVYATTCPGEGGGGNGNCRYLSGGLYNLSVHDNLLDDINEQTYSPGTCCSDGFLFLIQTDEPTNWPHDILIDHNTGFPVGSGIANVTIVAPPQVFTNFSFTNNLMTTGNGGFHQVLPGNKQPGCGTTSAAGMIGTLNGCMGSTWTAAGNVFANTSVSKSSKLGGSPLPARNFEAPSSDAVGFTDFNNGNGGNYQLSPSSPYKNAATDGTDPGANIDALQTATAGIL